MRPILFHADRMPLGFSTDVGSRRYDSVTNKVGHMSEFANVIMGSSKLMRMDDREQMDCFDHMRVAWLCRCIKQKFLALYRSFCLHVKRDVGFRVSRSGIVLRHDSLSIYIYIYIHVQGKIARMQKSCPVGSAKCTFLSLAMAAVWLASFPDGAKRDGENETCLYPPTWMISASKRVCCDDDVPARIFSCFGGGYKLSSTSFDPIVSVRALLQISPDISSCEYSRGSLAQWDRESQAMLDMYNDPLDAYSLQVQDVFCCTRCEPLEYVWTKEQTLVANRSCVEGRYGGGARRRAKPSLPFGIADWGGSAGDVLLHRVSDDATWNWHGDFLNTDGAGASSEQHHILSESDEDQVVPQCRSNSDSDSGVGCLSSDADEARSTFSSSDALAEWSIKKDPNHIPCLVLPEPMVRLICAGRWKSLVFLARWHLRTCDSDGNLPFEGTHLFANVPWPPLDSQVWAMAGQHSKFDVADEVADMNHEDASSRLACI